MEDLTEAGHVARWQGTHYTVTGPNGIELGMIELVGDTWEWAEYATEYDREVDLGTRSYDSPAAALHGMLESGGWLV